MVVAGTEDLAFVGAGMTRPGCGLTFRQGLCNDHPLQLEQAEGVNTTPQSPFPHKPNWEGAARKQTWTQRREGRKEEHPYFLVALLTGEPYPSEASALGL